MSPICQEKYFQRNIKRHPDRMKIKVTSVLADVSFALHQKRFPTSISDTLTFIWGRWNKSFCLWEISFWRAGRTQSAGQISNCCLWPGKCVRYLRSFAQMAPINLNRCYIDGALFANTGFHVFSRTLFQSNAYGKKTQNWVWNKTRLVGFNL